MYTEFFGLNHFPFKITPDLKYFYKYASREDIAQTILYSLSRGDGILTVIGEIGSGKTTLLRMVSKNIPKNIIKVYINSPNLSPIDFLKTICTELSIPVDKTASKSDIVKSLQDFLISKYTNKMGVVLLIDEAQSMTIDTLEEVRLLGNLETQTQKLLQIVLFGQPELDVTLNDNMLKSLKDRIACNVLLPHFNFHEVKRYLNSRMQIAGYVGNDVFSLRVAKKVHKLTQGLPRAINLLADKLLMAAFVDDSEIIKVKHFKLLEKKMVWSTKLTFYVLLLLLSLIIVFFVFQYKDSFFTKEGQYLNIDTVKTEQKKTHPPVVELPSEVTSKKKQARIEALFNTINVVEVNGILMLDKKALKNIFTAQEMEGIIKDRLLLINNVLQRLSNWRDYWSARDLESYIALYTENYFVTTFNSREKWIANRALNFQSKAYIKLKLTNVKVYILDINTVKVTFLQHYQSNVFSDTSIKMMIWKKENGNWKIFQEEVQR